MKFAIALFFACAVCVSGQAQPVAGVNPFIAGNPYAVAFNPFLSGLFGGAAAAPAAAASPAVPAAPPAVAAPFGGLSIGSFFQSVVLQKEAERLLSQPNFPADLAARVEAVVTTAQEGFTGCTGATLPWMEIRCVKPLLMAAKNELKLIDNEWQAILAATTAAPPAAAPAPAAAVA